MELKPEDLDLLKLFVVRRRRSGQVPPHGYDWSDVFQESVIQGLKDKTFDPNKGSWGGRLYFYHWRAYCELYRRAKQREHLDRQLFEETPEKESPESLDFVELEDYLNTLTPTERKDLLDPAKRQTAKHLEMVQTAESRFYEWRQR